MEYKQISIDKELHKKIKVYASSEDKSIKDFLEEIIKEKLKEKGLE